MNDLLTTILQNITTKPDAVQISMETEGDVDVYTIKVDPEDVGRVIGKSGKVIRAIRSLAHVSAVQQQKRVRVHLDDGGPQKTVTPQTELNQAATEIVEPTPGEVKPEAIETPEITPEPVEVAPELTPEVTPEPIVKGTDPVVEVETPTKEATPTVEATAAVEAAPLEVPERETLVEDLLPEERAK